MASKKHIALFSSSATQRSLENPYLDPSQTKLDSRGTSELLSFIAKLSEQFWYYDENDRKRGDWGDFFKTDLLTILATVADSDQQAVYRRMLDFNKAITFTTNRDDKADFLWESFRIGFKTVFRINRWYQTMSGYHPDHSFQAYLKEIIWKRLSFVLRELYSYYHLAIQQKTLHDKEKIDNQFKEFELLDVIWNFNPFPNIRLKKADSYHFEKNTTSFMEGVGQATKNLFTLYEAIIKRAALEFEKSLDTQKTEPHVALLVTFLKLYKHQQESLNQLVSKHLDFHYKSVLDFKPAAASPDQGYLLFTINKNLESYLLPKKTSLVGGSDPLGNPILFETDRGLLVTSSVISDYKTLTRSADVFTGGTISQFAAPVVDKQTGKNYFFPMFGMESAGNIKLAPVAIGFALSSPDFYMEGGSRCIKLEFALDEAESSKSASSLIDLTDSLSFKLTGGKGWFSPDKTSVTLDQTNGKIELLIHLSHDNQALVDYNEKLHGKGYSTNWPVVSVTLESASNGDLPNGKGIYDMLDQLKFKKCDISTSVTSLPATVLQSPAGKLSTTTAASPFGNIPTVGNRFVVGSYESFIKNIKGLELTLNWVNLPDKVAFREYYAAYNKYIKAFLPQKSRLIKNEYTCDLQWLTTKQGWKDTVTNVSLFTGNGTDKVKDWCGSLEQPASGQPNEMPAGNDPEEDKSASKTKQTPDSTISSVSYQFDLSNMQPDYSLQQPLKYSEKSTYGFVALSLKSPDLAFGNEIYPQVVAEVTLENTLQAAKDMKWWWFWGKKKKFEPLPNKPLLPKIKGVDIAYNSSSTLDLSTDSVNQFYHIHPYGVQLVESIIKSNTKEDASVPFVPHFPSNGYAYLSFKQLLPGSSLTLFVGVKDRPDARIDENFQEVTVECLTTNGWQKSSINFDSTYGLNKTGIIEVSVLPNITNECTVMSSGLYWLRISANEHTVSTCSISMIGTNAVSASRKITSQDARLTITNLPAGKITKFLQSDPAVAKVSQPFTTFGGEAPETEHRFRRRVSQRLSNKNRGTSAQAIKSLVLDRFQEVYRVIVIANRSLAKPRTIQVALVPSVSANDGVDLFKPIAPASTLSQVLEYLKGLVSAHLNLEVLHAQFEEIKVSVDVTYDSQDMTTQLDEELQKDIREYLSPWIRNNQLAYTGGELTVNHLLQFVSSRPYVRSFSHFQVYLGDKLISQSDQTGGEQLADQVIKPTNPLAILISAANHDINKTATVKHKRSLHNEKVTL